MWDGHVAAAGWTHAAVWTGDINQTNETACKNQAWNSQKREKKNHVPEKVVFSLSSRPFSPAGEDWTNERQCNMSSACIHTDPCARMDTYPLNGASRWKYWHRKPRGRNRCFKSISFFLYCNQRHIIGRCVTKWPFFLKHICFGEPAAGLTGSSLGKTRVTC